MRSINILEEISDGKLYDIEDIVKADTCGCDGCNDCCRDVGELVVPEEDEFNRVMDFYETLLEADELEEV